VLGTWIFCFVASYILLRLVHATMGLRATAEDEVRGLDVSEHSENGYQW